MNTTSMQSIIKTPRGTEAPVFSREEITPIAVEMFKLCRDTEVAAETAVRLLQECHRVSNPEEQKGLLLAHEFSAVFEMQEFHNEPPLSDDQLAKLPVQERWKRCAEVDASALLKHATGQQRLDRAIPRLIEFAEEWIIKRKGTPAEKTAWTKSIEVFSKKTVATKDYFVGEPYLAIILDWIWGEAMAGPSEKVLDHASVTHGSETAPKIAPPVTKSRRMKSR